MSNADYLDQVADGIIIITRCKDCHWWNRKIPPKNPKIPERRCFLLGRWTAANWFCADGERKETEDAVH